MKMNKRNTTGESGVTFRKDRNNYRASVVFNGKKYSLGSHESFESASIAVDEFRRLNGFHENHGR
ncbi:putative transcription factor [Shigella phage Sf12]|uniref:Putative transcription factor n=1 Tax=Shigella phage Sf12 TaxID=2024315 RepID=A0A291AXP7_9CAUD|nr:putative transcription factor [Shigella phage Sf12]ATE85768.1 putative transcription factor [Shigella phage Sf12]